MPNVNIAQSLKAGVLEHLKETWRQSMPTFEKQQKLLLKQLPYTSIRNASYPFKESVPFVKLYPYGKPRTYQTFQDRVLQMNIVPYDLTIKWSRWDSEDDQLGDLKQHVQMAVERYGQLPDVLISEYFNGVADLNPDLLNAFDGANLFSAVDGDGQNRLGVLGGNIITGSGLTVAGVIHDINVAQRRFLDMVDPTAGKPIFSPDEVAYTKLHVIGPNEANEVFQKAANAEYIRSDAGVTVAESNWMKSSFTYHINPYLTDAQDYYVAVEHPYWKPFAYRAPKDVESIIADMNNSDRAREYMEEMLYTQVRTRLGIWMPATIIKVNN